jgi:hypothetical protein
VALGAATTQADELLVAAFDRGLGAPPTTGFTAFTNGTANACATSGSPEYGALPLVRQSQTVVYPLYCIVAATGTYQATGGFDSVTDAWTGVMATYRGAP